MHPGGPFWAKKDLGAWSIPKGEHEDAEDALACALREFEEETGTRRRRASSTTSARCSQKSGKVVQAWALEGDLDAAAVRSNTFTMEWPPRSGRKSEFPEVDRAEWFSLDAGARAHQPRAGRISGPSGRTVRTHDPTIGCKRPGRGIPVA